MEQMVNFKNQVRRNKVDLVVTNAPEKVQYWK